MASPRPDLENIFDGCYRARKPENEMSIRCFHSPPSLSCAIIYYIQELKSSFHSLEATPLSVAEVCFPILLWPLVWELVALVILKCMAVTEPKLTQINKHVSGSSKREENTGANLRITHMHWTVDRDLLWHQTVHEHLCTVVEVLLHIADGYIEAAPPRGNLLGRIPAAIEETARDALVCLESILFKHIDRASDDVG